MAIFNPKGTPPTIIVKSVYGLEQLRTIVDGYCAISRTPEHLLSFRVSGKFRNIIRPELYDLKDCEASIYEDSLKVLVKVEFGEFFRYVVPVEPFDVEIGLKDA